jgi:hypothetical protein
MREKNAGSGLLSNDDEYSVLSNYLESSYTDKKENEIFLIYRETQSGAVAKSYMTNGLLI